MWAGRHRAEGGGGDLHREHVLGNLDDTLRREVLSLFSSVRRYVEGRFPHRAQAFQDCSFSFKFTKEDEPSSGSSAGLPIAMAFFSAMLDVPVPQDLAFTGALVTDSHASLVVCPVGDVDVKVEGALSRRIRRVLVPAANLDQLDESDVVPPAVVREAVIPVTSFDEALEATFGMGVWEL
ncbi:hypothetical protein L6R50_01710 [Myxococcota bacterium]|nr:hypothetical protein [Myxococcota bacterium]